MLLEEKIVKFRNNLFDRRENYHKLLKKYDWVHDNHITNR